MREKDLDQVLAIERTCFPSPWSPEVFLHEIRHDRAAANLVLEQGESVVGYACAWFSGPELKINNLAVHREHRRRGLASRMLLHLMGQARRAGCRRARLEVRPSNRAALALYRRYGFVVVGRVANYYRIEGEDALVLAVELDRPVAGGGERGV
jgi:ribosomal-protein-alanine N-acetyltransferase